MLAVKNLGINTVHIQVDELDQLGIHRIEACLGRGKTHEEMLEKIDREIAYATERSWPYSIHLPLEIFDWYDHDYLSAFYLDPDAQLRDLSFRFLEANLERLCRLYNPEYFVLHFPGVYHHESMDAEAFDRVLMAGLDRLEDVAAAYDVRILLEYFGSNVMFSDPEQWVDRLASYAHLGILVDTGHLYFASLLRGFDFDWALTVLADQAEAFHLWTTKGDRPYGNNPHYKAYHHIVPHIEQRRADGFAFDTREVLDLLLTKEKPLIIEASPYYKGRGYYEEGVRSVVSHLTRG